MTATDIEQAVRRLCADVALRLMNRPIEPLGERLVRGELVGCILSSQVSYASSARWAGAIADAGYLEDEWWHGERRPAFRAGIRNVLLGKNAHSRMLGRYRFANVRASQIAGARDAVEGNGVLECIAAGNTINCIRADLVARVPGLGPKTASMLLRNLAVSLDLAVLDRHVLRFMHLAGLVDNDRPPRSLHDYEKAETAFLWYASALGYPAGCLDWAIWATMKAAAELA